MFDRKRQRTVRVQVYLTPREAQEVEAAIGRAEVPGAEWRRNAILDAARRVLHSDDTKYSTDSVS